MRTTFTACDGAGEVAPDDSNCFMDSSGHLAAQDHFLSQMDEQSENQETVVRQDVGEFGEFDTESAEICTTLSPG